MLIGLSVLAYTANRKQFRSLLNAFVYPAETKQLDATVTILRKHNPTH